MLNVKDATTSLDEAPFPVNYLAVFFAAVICFAAGVFGLLSNRIYRMEVLPNTNAILNTPLFDWFLRPEILSSSVILGLLIMNTRIVRQAFFPETVKAVNREEVFWIVLELYPITEALIFAVVSSFTSAASKLIMEVINFDNVCLSVYQLPEVNFFVGSMYVMLLLSGVCLSVCSVQLKKNPPKFQMV